MEFIPHNYQIKAIDHIKENPVSAVFLDMGLGKTVITLTAINDLIYDSFEVSKVLVIAPLRVARDTWIQEVQKWEHLKYLRCSVVVGTEKERLLALNREADIYIINRENVPWLIEKSGVKFFFDMIVIDELSSFKNHQSKRFKCLIRERPKVKRIVGLTGTPAPNSLMDLWAQFRVLDKGERLGKFITQFRMNYFIPDKQNGMVVYSYKPIPGADKKIYSLISDITISMKATDYLQMPELISSEYDVYLSEDETEKYKAMKKELVIELTENEITAGTAAALSNKLCQMANGTVYADNGEIFNFHERKLDALEDIVEAANGKPFLLAYWYKHELSRITERLKKTGVKYSVLSSAESMKAWNDGKLQVGIVHPASVGHGLNLQKGGSMIVWFGLTWSLELYQQTIARLWRQGQTSETVVITHIVTKNTIDERILKVLKTKDKSQDALIEAVKTEVNI